MVERRGIQWVHNSDTRRPPDELNQVDFQVDNMLTAGLAQRSTHFHEEYSMSETEMVLLGVFKHQHLNFCKRDFRTPARVYNVIMSAWIIVRSGTLDVDIRGVPFIEGFFISGG
jgi:hypothetical protein